MHTAIDFNPTTSSQLTSSPVQCVRFHDESSDYVDSGLYNNSKECTKCEETTKQLGEVKTELVKTIIDSNKSKNDFEDSIKAKDNKIKDLKANLEKMKMKLDQTLKEHNLNSVEIQEKNKLIDGLKTKQAKKDLEHKSLKENLLNKIGNHETKIKNLTEQNDKKTLELKNEKSKIKKLEKSNNKSKNKDKLFENAKCRN